MGFTHERTSPAAGPIVSRLGVNRSLVPRMSGSPNSSDEGTVASPLLGRSLCETPQVGPRGPAGPTRDVRHFLYMAAGAASAAIFLRRIEADPFARYFGSIDPLVVVLGTTVAGAASLRALRAHGWPVPQGAASSRTVIGRSLGAALVFAASAIAFDRWIPFPADMNIEWPTSLVFYPAVAFVAETAFHLMPLALLVSLFGSDVRTARPWLLITFVAMVESVFQVAGSAGADPRQVAFVGVHLFLIGLFEVTAFRRQGFLAMASFRLIYYLLWHIAWGYLRLAA